MDGWHATILGLRHLPREVTAFEVEVFFKFSAEEARIIEERRRPESRRALFFRSQDRACASVAERRLSKANLEQTCLPELVHHTMKYEITYLLFPDILLQP